MNNENARMNSTDKNQGAMYYEATVVRRSPNQEFVFPLIRSLGLVPDILLI